MFQVRIHGRAGQGVASGAELLAVAGALEGRHAQAFPSYGAERVGAPVVAFCRLDEKAIRLREPVLAPDALIIQDATLLRQLELFGGMHAGGWVLLDSSLEPGELGLAECVRSCDRSRLRTLPASAIAARHLGRALPNVPLLAGLAALTGKIRLDSLVEAIRRRFPDAVAARNVAAAHEAFDAARRTHRVAHA